MINNLHVKINIKNILINYINLGRNRSPIVRIRREHQPTQTSGIVFGRQRGQEERGFVAMDGRLTVFADDEQDHTVLVGQGAPARRQDCLRDGRL